jgi:hypothetical protein
VFRDLPASQLAALTDVMHHLDKAPPSPRANRRKSVRHALHTTLDAILLNNEEKPQIKIFTRNISTAGLGFVCRRPFKMGERIAFYLQCLREERKIVVAQVTFVRYVRRGMYEMGAEFIQTVRESEATEALRRMVTV